MTIALLERQTDYLEIEIIYFMIDAIYKCLVNTTKTQNVSCFDVQLLRSNNNVLSYLYFAMSPNTSS